MDPRAPDTLRRESSFGRGIATPTFVSHGDADRFFSLDHPVHLRRTLPDARLAVLPGVDHPIQTLDAAAFAAMVGAFLQT